MSLPAKREDQLSANSLADPLAKFGQGAHSMGTVDTVRSRVLAYLIERDYDRAIGALKHFMAGRTDYPRLKPRLARYVNHCIDLINAIRAKRHFPGINSLTVSKQQELADRVRDHFDELQYVLKKMEKIQVQLQVEDSRSTVWVLRAAVSGVLIISLLAFVLDMTGGGYSVFYRVADDLFAQGLFKIFN